MELVLEAYEEYIRTQESLGKALGRAYLIKAKLEHGNMKIRKDDYNAENTIFQVDALEYCYMNWAVVIVNFTIQ